MGEEEDFDFDFSKKKKKAAAPAPSNDNEDGDDDDDDLDFDFGSKKKKKKSVTIAEDANKTDKDDDDNDNDKEDDRDDNADNGEKKPVPWAGSNRDYTYDELVDRVFDILAADRPDLASGRKKHQMKPPKVAREGTKKTVWINFPEMCRSMKRPADHVQSYVFAELGTTGSIDGGGRMIIKGRFQPKQIENVVRHYISEYVTCRTCRSPDTRLQKENRLYFLRCDTCNSQRTVSTVKKGFEAQVGKRCRAREAAAAAAPRK